MSDAKEIARGDKARAIINDPIYIEAHNKIQQRIFDDFAACDPQDTDAMQICRLRLKCLAEIARYLQEVMDTGTLAQHEKDLERQKKESVVTRLQRGIRNVF